MINTSGKGGFGLVGITASTICLIHCLASPFLFSILPAFGSGLMENVFIEWSLIGLSIVAGIVVLWNGYTKHHQNKNSFFVLAVAVLLFMLGSSFDNYLLQRGLHFAGGIFVALAIIINWKQSRQCKVVNAKVR